MDHLPTHVFLSTFLMALLLLSFSPTSSKELDEFNYDPNSEKGPAHWGHIRPEWYKCKNGTMQSPIGIGPDGFHLTSHLGNLHIDYHPSNATLSNTGHDIMLEWTGGAGYLLINGTRYILQQCHWHSPSEHTINGRRFDLEIHLVHKSEAGRIAVIGMFYEFRSPDPFFQTVMDDLILISRNRKAKVPLGVVHPEQVIHIDTRHYYRYMGSLTTPPCDENVVWTIGKQVKPVSKEQVRLLRVAVQDESYSNARPLQQVNDRLIQLQISEYLYKHK